MTKQDVKYVCDWLDNYITLYVINGEEEAYRMVRKLKEVLIRNRAKYTFNERTIDVRFMLRRLADKALDGEIDGEVIPIIGEICKEWEDHVEL